LHDGRLSPETLLQLAPRVRTRFDAAGHVLLDAPDGTVVDLGPRGYAALSLFAQPLALGEAIERLEREAPATDFAPTMNVVNVLIEEGALVRHGVDPGVARGWADPVEHARMLHDDRRTGDYLAALAQAVRPGDVVLDLGTGSGVLAIAAARAGARRVYAVEASDIAEVAEGVFAANGVTDTVTLVPGWSRELELPEPADLLVAELIGNEPFEEEILETTLDARRRLLKPGARLIPNTLTLLARPLRMPDGEARQRAIGRAAVERWRRLYGMEFQPLLDAAHTGPVNLPAEAEVVANWPPVGPAVPLAELDLTTFEEASVQVSADLVVDAPGLVNTVAVTFRAGLYGAIEHTLDPWTWPTSSWATSVWVLPDPVDVGPGAALRVHYSRRVDGAPDALTCELVG
jgi:precorrin-6B methylase 2